jgi:hypothetical protein
VAVVYPPLEINKTDSIAVSERLNIRRTKHKQPKLNNIEIDQDSKAVYLGQDPTAVYLGQDNASGIYLGQN